MLQALLEITIPPKKGVMRMTTPQSILKEMQKLTDEAEAEIAKLQKANEVAKESGGLMAVHTPEYLQEQTSKIGAALQEQIDTLRSEALVLVDEARRQADVEFYRAGQQLGPQTTEQWTEASARRSFVQSDVATLAPQDILSHYALVKNANDSIGSWLVLTEGLAHLDKVIADTTDVADNARAQQASRDLYLLGYGEPYEAYENSLSELDSFSRELGQPLTPREKVDYQQGIADSMGVKAEFVPV